MYVGFDYLLENFHAIENAINEIKNNRFNEQLRAKRAIYKQCHLSCLHYFI